MLKLQQQIALQLRVLITLQQKGTATKNDLVNIAVLTHTLNNIVI